MILVGHELKMNGKVLLLWSFCVGVINFGCLLLFESLADTMGEMADAYAQMGSFSTALGLDRMSISTMEGFYATELALIFAIGGAMFAAMTGAAILSKEEEGHTGEFLHALPFGRRYIVGWKYVSMLILILLFQIICVGLELAGFAAAGEMPEVRGYALFHGAQFLMQAETGSVCFLLSSLSRKKQTGAALGLAVLLYMADMLSRVVPDLENFKYITPYYYSNAADIFCEGRIDGALAGIGVGILVAAVVSAGIIYEKKDLF